MPEATIKSLEEAFGAVFDTLGGPATKANGGAGEFFMEIMDTRDMSVWMCMEPVTEEQYQAIQPEAPWMKSGRAPASMDMAAFAHSPGHPDEFRTTECCGLTFRNVAVPIDFNPTIFAQKGPIRLLVSKHHILGFKAGRELTVMDLDGEQFVELIGTDKHDADLELPEGASLRKVKLDSPLVVRLPTPTVTHFWFGKGRSFQGPLNLPELHS